MSPTEKAKFKEWVNSLNRTTQNKVKMNVVNSVNTMHRRALMLVPSNKEIGQGPYLKSSILRKIDPNRLGGSVYSFREYAPYVEWGTGTRVEVLPEDKDYAMTFKGVKSVVGIYPQPYLMPAKRIAIKELRSKLKNMGLKEVE